MDTRPEQSEGNTEPSQWGDPLEGVTTRGRVFRRMVGPCGFCGVAISKSWSDARGKMALFCGKPCMGKWMRRTFGPIRRKTVTPSTSPAPERDEIV